MDSKDATAPVEVREGSRPDSVNVDEVKIPPPETPSGSSKTPDTEPKSAERKEASPKKAAKEKRSKKHSKTKAKKSKKETAAEESSDDSDSDDESSSSSSSSSDSDSDSEDDKKKRATKKRHDIQKYKKKPKSRKHKKASKTQAPSDSSSSSDSGTSDESESSDGELEAEQRDQFNQQQEQNLLRQMQMQQFQQGNYGGGGGYGGGGLGVDLGTTYNRSFIPADPYRMPPPADDGRSRARRGMLGRGRVGGGLGRLDNGISIEISDPNKQRGLLLGGLDKKQQRHLGKPKRKSPRLDYKRVDHVWDNTIHAYKLQDTAEASTDAQYDEYIFHVRRSFDWEGKYKHTQVDIKSKLLRECLQEVMGNIKGVSLVEETPKVDPNMLFLYLDDLTKHLKALKKAKASGSDKHAKKKEQKRLLSKREHLKVLIKYINKDYSTVKSSLHPMLKNGLITFDLLWALWKPNTLAFTATYGAIDEPRVFKVEVAEKHYSIMKGEYYLVDGKYFEYDGKQFGFGSQTEEVGEFRGARKITSLPVYPLEYHKNEAQVRKDLIERGKKFVALSGVHYRAHQGLAFFKRKRAIVKVNINGRIMIDPSIHRRINPNYPISHVRPKDHDVLSDDDDDGDDDGCGCGSDSDEPDANDRGVEALEKPEKVKYVTKVVKDEKGKVQLLRLPKSLVEQEENKPEKLDKIQGKRGDDDADEDDKDNAADGEGDDANGGGKDKDKDDKKQPPEFTDEEYLIASPVVLGFAFAEKLWLELTVSGVKDIQWNETAYDSLVLEPKTKDIVKALVESHKYHAAESIDDVIQGKGKGLVAVLHGPPGTGKTLTAEGISELLKCPLYMVSAGELGTDSRFLETELQKILDICHAWGAILLLDEADVFLEKRNMHDIHRNALVSIFLRQLEYFQGILFLTTNRVETFDDAFQSRIHIALRYDSLTPSAKKAIFKIFIERVRVLEKIDLMPFTEEDYNVLARHELNGRQIKNTVRTAQALAVNKGEPLSMSHIRQVLDVQMSFDRDLKGGTGYQDAMRSYF